MLKFPIYINNVEMVSEDILSYYKKYGKKKTVCYIMEETGCSKGDAEEAANDVINMDIQITQPAKLNFVKVDPSVVHKVHTAQYVHDARIICPRCGSTAISTGARGVNWILGFIGASQTVNRCGNCGHTWKPRG